MDRRGFVGGLAVLGIGGGWAAWELIGSEGGAGTSRAMSRTASAGASARAGSAIPSPTGPGNGALGPGTLPDRWGVQLYTVRDQMAEDLRGTLEAVADMGYQEVEFAGLFDWSPRDLRSLLDDLGVRATSSHYPMQVVRESWEAALDVCETLGQTQVIVPSLPPDARSADGLRALAEEMNRAGEVARARGLTFGFHNHDFEVKPIEAPVEGGGRERPLDILLVETDPDLVSFQLDLFWAVHGGTDPTAWFADHPRRFTSVHVKDRTATGEMVSVGEGVLDFARLLSVGEEVGGVRHAFVEHDQPENSMASIRRSIDYLKTLTL